MADPRCLCRRCGAEASYGAEATVSADRFWLCLTCADQLRVWLRPSVSPRPHNERRNGHPLCCECDACLNGRSVANG